MTVKEEIFAILQDIFSKKLHLDVHQVISGLVVNDDHVGFMLDIAKFDNQEQAENVKNKCEKIILDNFSNITKVTIVFFGDKKKDNNVIKEKTKIPNVKKVILVGSGKGGVGKSTISVNLAIAFNKYLNKRVALVDADIYGPSIPKMLGIDGKPDIINNKIEPFFKHNIYSISMGNLMDENKAAIWRGPMLIKAIHQMLIGVNWVDIDILIIDMPPGTGDVQLSIAQNYIIDGAILVTTPQEVAVIDVRKAANMLDKLNIPIFGIIENMCYYLIDGVKHYIFGKDGGGNLSKELDVKLLAEIPLDNNIATSGDIGCPYLTKDANNAICKQYEDVIFYINKIM
jgi:ATP-binding protein involved in chromosome partitioning